MWQALARASRARSRQCPGLPDAVGMWLSPSCFHQAWAPVGYRQSSPDFKTETVPTTAFSGVERSKAKGLKDDELKMATGIVLEIAKGRGRSSDARAEALKSCRAVLADLEGPAREQATASAARADRATSRLGIVDRESKLAALAPRSICGEL